MIRLIRNTTVGLHNHNIGDTAATILSLLLMANADGQSNSRARRLLAVKGHDDRHNDVVYCSPASGTATAQSTVVFFGGDVQDYPERMRAHRDNHRHLQWNLEETCVHVSDAFPDSDVLVIRPARMLLATFSCYDNFVACSQNGAPLADGDDTDGGRQNPRAINHLVDLVHNALLMVHTDTPDAVDDTRQLIPIGFSKGCVVLNRFAQEIANDTDNRVVTDFLKRVNSMYWLDGGHAGGSNVWITDRDVLQALARAGIKIHVHVTPYQMEDDNRPWIRQEEKQFVTTLRALGADVTRTMHFAGRPPSIEMHFAVITEFHKQ